MYYPFTDYNRNCAELYKSGSKISGVYTIDPDGSGPFDVYCDQTTARGGWTVFQKRLDGSVDFYRGWADYKRGFGNLKGEFWLGLDKINRLTNRGRYKLRVDLEDTNRNTAYAEYSTFEVSDERNKFKDLTLVISLACQLIPVFSIAATNWLRQAKTKSFLFIISVQYMTSYTLRGGGSA